MLKRVPALAAKQFFDIEPSLHNCFAFEDSFAGVTAAVQANMQVIALCDSSEEDKARLKALGAHQIVSKLDISELPCQFSSVLAMSQCEKIMPTI